MLFTENYTDQISGVLHCFDRVIIQGTIPGLCCAGGMTSYLYFNKIRIFDSPQFSAPFKEELRNNAEKIASSNGIDPFTLYISTWKVERHIADLIESKT